MNLHRFVTSDLRLTPLDLKSQAGEMGNAYGDSGQLLTGHHQKSRRQDYLRLSLFLSESIFD